MRTGQGYVLAGNVSAVVCACGLLSTNRCHSVLYLWQGDVPHKKTMGSEMATGEQYMTVGEAREYLGVGNHKMARMLQDGTLPWQPDPLDQRSKLVKRSDVETLASRSAKRAA